MTVVSLPLDPMKDSSSSQESLSRAPSLPSTVSHRPVDWFLVLAYQSYRKEVCRYCLLNEKPIPRFPAHMETAASVENVWGRVSRFSSDIVDDSDVQCKQGVRKYAQLPIARQK